MIYRLFIYPVLFLFFFSTSVLAEKITVYPADERSGMSLASMALALNMQPDWYELPVVMTKDAIPVVYNDIFLSPFTNVATLFPERKRADGNYYIVDFTLAEIQQLRFKPTFTDKNFSQHITTFEESLSYFTLFTNQTGKTIQSVPVIKFPWFFRNEGIDISRVVLQKLISSTSSSERSLYLKSYDPDELQRIKKDLLPGLPIEVRLIQGIEQNDGRETMRLTREKWTSYNYDWLFTRIGLRVLNGYADIMTLKSMNVVSRDILNRLVLEAHTLDMKCIIAAPPPSSAIKTDEMYNDILYIVDADGIITKNIENLSRYIDTNQVTRSPLQNQPSEKKDATASILADPEELSRRLQQMETQKDQ